MKALIPASAAALLDFIAKPESNGNYLAYYGHGGNTTPLPATLDAVLAFQDRLVTVDKQKSSAIGRYQIMPKTLRSLMSAYRISGDTAFTPDEQDSLALLLLIGRGYNDWTAGKISDGTFADNLSKEWASLPFNTGKSYYDGDGLNHALVSRSTFLAAIAKARTANGAASAPAVTPAATTPSDPIVDFFNQVGQLASSMFGEALSGVIAAANPPQAAPPASGNGQTAGATNGLDTMLKLAEFFLANFKSFGAYATVLPHLVNEIPDIVSKVETMIAKGEQLVADVKSGKLSDAANDFQAIFAAVESILNDVGINLGTISGTIALMPNIPTVAGLQAVPALTPNSPATAPKVV